MAVAGIDPHRESFTIAVVNEVGVPLETVSWPATPAGFESGAEFLTSHGVSVVGVEGSGSNGRHVAAALTVAGFDVREVPPRRSVQWRGGERRSKTDRIDALSVARVTGSDPDLGPAKVVLDAAFGELEVVRSRRVSVIDHLKRTLADADRQLAELPPALTSEVGSKGDTRTRLRRLLATDPVSDNRAVAARLGWLGELSDEIRQLDAKARALANQMGALLDEHGSTLTDIYGLGPVSATEIVLRVGDPTRFETESAFARWNGTAPVAVSSGEGDGPPRRHRLDLGGCRAVNSSLHIVSITQSGRDPLAKAFLARNRAAGKTGREARRSHKRRLSDVVIRRMWADHKTTTATTPATPITAEPTAEPLAA